MYPAFLTIRNMLLFSTTSFQSGLSTWANWMQTLLYYKRAKDNKAFNTRTGIVCLAGLGQAV